jgi:hypothetical protein
MRRKTACTIQFSKSLAEASMDTIAYWGQRLRAGCNSFHPAASSRECVVGWMETMASATLLLFRLTPRERGWT